MISIGMYACLKFTLSHLKFSGDVVTMSPPHPVGGGLQQEIHSEGDEDGCTKMMERSAGMPGMPMTGMPMSGPSGMMGTRRRPRPA